jgi:hypothetical protein
MPIGELTCINFTSLYQLPSRCVCGFLSSDELAQLSLLLMISINFLFIVSVSFGTGCWSTPALKSPNKRPVFIHFILFVERAYILQFVRAFSVAVIL